MTAREQQPNQLATQPNGQPLDVFAQSRKPDQHITEGLSLQQMGATPAAQPQVNVEALLAAAFNITKSPYIYRLMRVRSEGPRIG